MTKEAKTMRIGYCPCGTCANVFIIACNGAGKEISISQFDPDEAIKFANDLMNTVAFRQEVVRATAHGCKGSA